MFDVHNQVQDGELKGGLNFFQKILRKEEYKPVLK